MECADSKPIAYEKYIENRAIPKTYATIYTCTLCNTNFKIRQTLEEICRMLRS